MSKTQEVCLLICVPALTSKVERGGHLPCHGFWEFAADLVEALGGK